jgi:hypothetical protein
VATACGGGAFGMSRQNPTACTACGLREPAIPPGMANACGLSRLLASANSVREIAMRRDPWGPTNSRTTPHSWVRPGDNHALPPALPDRYLFSGGGRHGSRRWYGSLVTRRPTALKRNRPHRHRVLRPNRPHRHQLPRRNHRHRKARMPALMYASTVIRIRRHRSRAPLTVRRRTHGRRWRHTAASPAMAPVRLTLTTMPAGTSPR